MIAKEEKISIIKATNRLTSPGWVVIAEPRSTLLRFGMRKPSQYPIKPPQVFRSRSSTSNSR